jgi:hypothetical protein
MASKTFARQQPFAIGLGALFTAAGLLLNEWFFEEIFVPDGHLDRWLVNGIIIFQLLVIVTGVGLILHRCRVRLSFSAAIAALVMACVVGLAGDRSALSLPAPPWMAKQLSMTERLALVERYRVLDAEVASDEKHAALTALPLSLFRNSIRLRLKKATALLVRGKTAEAIEEFRTVQENRCPTENATAESFVFAPRLPGNLLLAPGRARKLYRCA